MKMAPIMAFPLFCADLLCTTRGEQGTALVRACLRRAVIDRLHVDACVHAEAGVGKSDLGISHD